MQRLTQARAARERQGQQLARRGAAMAGAAHAAGPQRASAPKRGEDLSAVRTPDAQLRPRAAVGSQALHDPFAGCRVPRARQRAQGEHPAPRGPLAVALDERFETL